MERRESSYECPVCGNEHVHSVYVYRFDMDGVKLGESMEKGAVTLHVDKYADTRVEVDDGYVLKRKDWNSVSGIMTVSIIEHEEEV